MLAIQQHGPVHGRGSAELYKPKTDLCAQTAGIAEQSELARPLQAVHVRELGIVGWS